MIVNDNAFASNNPHQFGFRVPDIVANLRVDQAWGFAGISGVLHDASGAITTPRYVVHACGCNWKLVNNGHPEDKYGWALAAGAKFNLQGGDMIGFNVCYCRRRGRLLHQPRRPAQLYNNSDQRGCWLDR